MFKTLGNKIKPFKQRIGRFFRKRKEPNWETELFKSPDLPDVMAKLSDNSAWERDVNRYMDEVSSYDGNMNTSSIHRELDRDMHSELLKKELQNKTSDIKLVTDEKVKEDRNWLNRINTILARPLRKRKKWLGGKVTRKRKKYKKKRNKSKKNKRKKRNKTKKRRRKNKRKKTKKKIN